MNLQPQLLMGILTNMDINTKTITIRGTTNLTAAILNALCPAYDDDGNPTNFTTQDKWNALKRVRDDLLSEVDYVQLPDVVIDDNTKDSVDAYRQSLRDITNYPTPEEVVFPEKPI